MFFYFLGKASTYFHFEDNACCQVIILINFANFLKNSLLRGFSILKCTLGVFVKLKKVQCDTVLANHSMSVKKKMKGNKFMKTSD